MLKLFFVLFCFVNIIQIVDEYCLVLMRKRESRSMSDDEEGEGGGGESKCVSVLQHVDLLHLFCHPEADVTVCAVYAIKKRHK